jgi:hypothetical protein
VAEKCFGFRSIGNQCCFNKSTKNIFQSLYKWQSKMGIGHHVKNLDCWMVIKTFCLSSIELQKGHVICYWTLHVASKGDWKFGCQQYKLVVIGDWKMVSIPPLLVNKTQFWSPSKFGEKACNMFLEIFHWTLCMAIKCNQKWVTSDWKQ